MLDHRVVELALGLPPAQKLDGPVTKSSFQGNPEAPSARLDPDRQQAGFGAPLADWFDGGFGDLARDLLLTNSHAARLLEPNAIRGLTELSFSNLHADWRAPLRLWTLLMLELWARNSRRNSASEPAE